MCVLLYFRVGAGDLTTPPLRIPFWGDQAVSGSLKNLMMTGVGKHAPFLLVKSECLSWVNIYIYIHTRVRLFKLVFILQSPRFLVKTMFLIATTAETADVFHDTHVTLVTIPCSILQKPDFPSSKCSKSPSLNPSWLNHVKKIAGKIPSMIPSQKKIFIGACRMAPCSREWSTKRSPNQDSAWRH